MKKIKKCLIILIITMLIPMSSYAGLESDVIYRLNDPTNIQLTNFEIELQDLVSDVKTFDESMAEKDLLLSTDNTGETSTQIYYENEEDRLAQTARVDIDFKGLTIPAPANVVFLMDQSGSMNMGCNWKNSSKYASPCMNPSHYYRIRVVINGKDYVFYYNPSEINLIDSWANVHSTIRTHIGGKAVQQGLATNANQVTIKNISFNSGDAPENNHYEAAEPVTTISEENRFFEYDIANPYNQTEEEKKVFEKVNLGFLEDAPATSVAQEQFYSPAQWYNTPGAPTTPDWREIGSDAYFEYLNTNSLCYDRMTVSKILFEELSDYAISENPDNKVGFAKYAGTIRETRELEHTDFEGTTFSELNGFGGTNWGAAYNEARDMFNTGNLGQNMVVMVTDGRPSVAPNTPDAIKTVVDGIATDFDALMFFVGVSLSDSVMTQYSDSASTKNSAGEDLAYNGKSLEDFDRILDELKKILTSTTNMSSEIASSFELRIDDTHPITVEYIYNHDGVDVREKVELKSLEEAEKLGITYDSTTNKISWDMHKTGIHSVRLSYYEKLKEDILDWDKIESTGKIEGITNGSVNIDYVDETGKPEVMDDNETATFVLENTSYLTIENHTTTPYEVKSGEQIDYVITVKNNGTLDANNLVVKQKIPDNTIFKSTDLGVYNKDTNDITFTVPELKANESIELRYSVTANGYNVIIQSSAQLGVSTNLTTFDANNWPILSAVVLEHKTSEQIIVEDSNENIEDFIDKFIPLPNTGYFDGGDFDPGNLITRIIYTTILLGIIYGMLRKKDKKK